MLGYIDECEMVRSEMFLYLEADEVKVMVRWAASSAIEFERRLTGIFGEGEIWYWKDWGMVYKDGTQLRIWRNV